MRSFYYSLSFLLMNFVAASQSFQLSGTDTINKTDAFGKKQGKWIVTGKNRPGECYREEQKVEEGRYSDNRKTGLWFEYYCNEKMKSRVTFANGRPNGPVKLFHDNGKISEEGIWQNGRWVGNYRLYYDNGQVQHEFVFDESGRRAGQQKYYFENGQLAIEGNFVNGKENGLIKEYHENGDLKAEKTYNDGAVDEKSIRTFEPKHPIRKAGEEAADNAPVVKVREDEKPNEAALPAGKKLPNILNGKYTLYNRNRQVTKDGIFKDNRFMDGEAYFYNENGLLERIAVYKNGIYVGDTQVQE